MEAIKGPIGKVTHVETRLLTVYAKIAGRWYRLNDGDLSARGALTSIQDFVSVDGELVEDS